MQQRNQSECARASTVDQAMPAPEAPGEPARHIDTQTRRHAQQRIRGSAVKRYRLQLVLTFTSE